MSLSGDFMLFIALSTLIVFGHAQRLLQLPCKGGGLNAGNHDCSVLKEGVADMTSARVDNTRPPNVCRGEESVIEDREFTSRSSYRDSSDMQQGRLLFFSRPFLCRCCVL